MASSLSLSFQRRHNDAHFQWQRFFGLVLVMTVAVEASQQQTTATSTEQHARQRGARATTASSRASTGDSADKAPPLLDILSNVMGGAASSSAARTAARGGAGVGGGAPAAGAAGQCAAPCSGTNSVAVPKEASLRPYSNGCSVPVMLRDSLPNYQVFEECCDLHDACYMACGIAKSTCDASFGRCLQSACPTQQRMPVDECRNMAGLFSTGVQLFGCAGYQSLQHEGCECVEEEMIAEIRMEAYIEAFYRVYNTTHPEPPPMARNLLRQGPDKWGTLIYALYQKYPQSIHIISRDGQSSRTLPSYFQRIDDEDEVVEAPQ